MAKPKVTEVVAVTPPNIRTLKFTLVGTAPYCQNKFSHKAKEAMMSKQAAGSTAKKGKTREAKDFDQCYEEALYRSREGWCGIPAGSIRSAMISACRLVGFKMTIAKMSLFVHADGIDAKDAVPLVMFSSGEPHPVDSALRNQTGVMDVRRRPVWDPGWKADVLVDYDADQFTAADVTNLLLRAGVQVGIGEGRPDSRLSTGCGWGTFALGHFD